MKPGKMLAVVVISLALILQLAGPGPARAEHQKVVVESLSTAFGTTLYVATSAFEQVFKKANSFVDWQLKETPGAMYMIKYFYKNKEAIAAGKKNQITIGTSSGILGHINEARPPFKAFKGLKLRALFSTNAFIYLVSTFDPSIKNMKDLAGKKVGTAEKPRVFAGTLLNRPYYKKGLGIWDKVKWQTIGVINSKNAMLNNKIDADSSIFMGRVERAPDGTLVCNKMEPSTAAMELLNSGRKLHLLDNDPELIKKSYDFNRDMMVFPVLIKMGAHKCIERDMWARCVMGIYVAPASMPDDVVQEIIRVRYQYADDLKKYHAAMGLYSKNPYPVGVPDKWIHPGVKKAMKALNIPIP